MSVLDNLMNCLWQQTEMVGEIVSKLPRYANGAPRVVQRHFSWVSLLPIFVIRFRCGHPNLSRLAYVTRMKCHANVLGSISCVLPTPAGNLLWCQIGSMIQKTFPLLKFHVSYYLTYMLPIGVRLQYVYSEAEFLIQYTPQKGNSVGITCILKKCHANTSVYIFVVNKRRTSV